MTSQVDDRVAFTHYEEAPARQRQSRDMSPIDKMKQVYAEKPLPTAYELGQVGKFYQFIQYKTARLLRTYSS